MRSGDRVRVRLPVKLNALRCIARVEMELLFCGQHAEDNLLLLGDEMR